MRSANSHRGPSARFAPCRPQPAGEVSAPSQRSSRSSEDLHRNRRRRATRFYTRSSRRGSIPARERAGVGALSAQRGVPACPFDDSPHARTTVLTSYCRHERREAATAVEASLVSCQRQHAKGPRVATSIVQVGQPDAATRRPAATASGPSRRGGPTPSRAPCHLPWRSTRARSSAARAPRGLAPVVHPLAAPLRPLPERPRDRQRPRLRRRVVDQPAFRRDPRRDLRAGTRRRDELPMPADVPAPAVEIEKLVGQVCGSLATAPREVVAVLDVSAEEADGLGVVVVAERRRTSHPSRALRRCDRDGGRAREYAIPRQPLLLMWYASIARTTSSQPECSLRRSASIDSSGGRGCRCPRSRAA